MRSTNTAVRWSMRSGGALPLMKFWPVHPVDDVDCYRENAELMRRAAELATGKLRIQMLEIAAAWDDLADSSRQSRMMPAQPHP